MAFALRVSISSASCFPVFFLSDLRIKVHITKSEISMRTWRAPMSAASQGAFVVIPEIPSVDKGTHDLQRSICFCTLLSSLTVAPLHLAHSPRAEANIFSVNCLGTGGLLCLSMEIRALCHMQMQLACKLCETEYLRFAVVRIETFQTLESRLFQFPQQNGKIGPKRL